MTNSPNASASPGEARRLLVEAHRLLVAQDLPGCKSKLDEALHRALQTSPTTSDPDILADTFQEYGIYYRSRREFLPAANHHQLALRHLQGQPEKRREILLSYACCRLALGDWQPEGLLLYSQACYTQLRPFCATHPTWEDGQRHSDQTLYLWYENGLGDLFWYLRNLAELQSYFKKIYFEVPRALEPFMKESWTAVPDNFEFVTKVVNLRIPESPAALPDSAFDVQVDITRASALLGFSPTHNGRDTVPYLHAAPQRSRVWGQKVAQLRQSICQPADCVKLVAINWQGRPDSDQAFQREIDIRGFLDWMQTTLAAQPDEFQIRFVSLQKVSRFRADQQPVQHPLLTYVENLDGQGAFLDTAAILPHLDLFVTTDTSTVHLAGAMEIKTFCFLSQLREWRWSFSESWYKSVEYFVPPEDQDFSALYPVMYERMLTALRAPGKPSSA